MNRPSEVRIVSKGEPLDGHRPPHIATSRCAMTTYIR